MSSLQIRAGITYAQLNIQIPDELKTNAKKLNINLTEVCVSAIKAEVSKREPKTT